MLKEDFYPALWSYGCPRHDDCREPLIFSGDKMRCPQHGGIYRVCEEEIAEPIDLGDTIICLSGVHALEHIEWDIDEKTDHYCIDACPECDPSEYYCDTDGPVGNSVFSLYRRQDEGGATISASCRACGLTECEDQRMTLLQDETNGEGDAGSFILSSEQVDYPSRASEGGSALSSVIDKALDRLVEWTSLAEDSFRFAAHRESAVPRWVQLVAGALCVPLSLLLGIGAFGIGAEVVSGSPRDLASIIAFATIATLSLFFATVSYRLLLARPRGSNGSLLSPALIIGFGLFLCSIGLWMLISGNGELTILLFGLAAVSAGLAFRQRARSAALDKRLPNAGVNRKDR